MKMTSEQFAARLFVDTGSSVDGIILVSNLGRVEKYVGKTMFNLANDAVRMLTEILASPSPDPDSFAGIRDFSKASLVYFRGTSEGKDNSEVCRIVQIPLYFEDVKPYEPISDADIASRERFARRTGFLLLGPDECLAIEHQNSAGDYRFVETFENNDLGILRSLAGHYANTLDFDATPRQIGELNVTETEKHLEETRGSYMWWHKLLSEVQRDRLQTSLRLLEVHIPAAPPERKSSGAIVKRSFIESGDTGSTAHLRPSQEGWIRYPTSQDAWYFGVWINPEKRQTLTYAEQDVAHTLCDTAEQFHQELKDMAVFYGRDLNPSIMGMGEDGVSLGFDCLTFLKGEAVTVTFDGTGKIDQQRPRNSQAPLMVEVTKSVLALVADDCLLNRSYNLKQGQEFAVNILDPRAFNENLEMQVTHQGNQQFEVVISMTGAGTTHKAILSLASA